MVVCSCVSVFVWGIVCLGGRVFERLCVCVVKVFVFACVVICLCVGVFV